MGLSPKSIQNRFSVILIYLLNMLYAKVFILGVYTASIKIMKCTAICYQIFWRAAWEITILHIITFGHYGIVVLLELWPPPIYWNTSSIWLSLIQNFQDTFIFCFIESTSTKVPHSYTSYILIFCIECCDNIYVIIYLWSHNAIGP